MPSSRDLFTFKTFNKKTRSLESFENSFSHDLGFTPQSFLLSTSREALCPGLGWGQTQTLTDNLSNIWVSWLSGP